MSTVDPRTMMAILEDDELLVIAYRYTHVNLGRELCAYFIDHRHDDMAHSPYVKDVRVIYENGAITPEGLMMMREYSDVE